MWLNVDSTHHPEHGLPGHCSPFGFLIGANVEHALNNGGGSQDPRVATSASNPPVEAAPNQTRSFACSLCNARFPTSIGRGQHMRHAHIEAYNRSIEVDRVKARWSKEETEIMAYEEAQASLKGEVTHMNQYLAGIIVHRTIEGIKGKRKQKAYKDLVQRYLDEGIEQGHATEEAMVETVAATPIESYNYEEIDRAINDNMEGIGNSQYPHVRKLIEIASLVMSGTPPEEASLSSWLRNVFKHAKAPKGPSYADKRVIEEKGKKKRRQEYAMIQKLYKKDFSSAARQVLAGEENVEMPPAEETIQFWKSIFEPDTETEVGMELDTEETSSCLTDLWKPVSAQEVKMSELKQGTAAGPDGVTVKNWNKIDVKLRTLFYNTILRRGHLEEDMKMARTVLIPKGQGKISPMNTRPLSITSVVVRQLHKILANRFKNLHNFNESQRAFIDCDGTMENLSIINTILCDAKISRREVHIATLDLRKAFDSVRHSTIINTITALKCPKPFVEYVKNQYTNAQTKLQYKQTETLINVRKGVLQGDPLSPLLFNAVMDRAIKAIPNHVGYRLNDRNFNCVAYADDIIIVTSTKMGMNLALEAFASSLTTFGLEVNIDKSSTMSLMPSGKDKKIKVLSEPQFKINNTYLEPIGPIGLWKYLGIYFEGARMKDTDVCFGSMLSRLDRAPLKPQQRLKILKLVAIPKYMHALILGRISKSKLENIDGTVRSHIKKWLRLPNDSPIAYLYADVNDGGLGIPKLSEQIPLIRKQRLERFISRGNDVSNTFKQSIYIQRQLEWCGKCLVHLGSEPNKKLKSKEWRRRLLNMIDTKDLVDANKGKSSNAWVESRSDQVSGGDFIKYHHIRVGVLPSKARTSRGRIRDRTCRAGCRVSETNYHTIQLCQRTHGGRVHRHDRVVEMLANHLKRRDRTTVLVEHLFKTPVGNRKPDLIVTKNGMSYVIDVQIVGGANMDRDRNTKIEKYRSIQTFDELVKSKCHSRDVFYHSVTISYKGIVERATIDLFKKLHISEHLQFMLVTSVLRGSWLNWNQFNKSTALTR